MKMSLQYPNCIFCSGEVFEKYIEWDYRRQDKHLIFQNVPAGVCQQCGETFFRPEISKRMDDAFHKGETTTHWVKIPVIHFKAA